MIRIVIVASIRLYREGLADLISRQDGLCVSGALPDLHDAEEHLKALAPDVVLLDMATAESDGTARALRLTETAVPIVAIGIADSDAEVLACAELGAVGYVTREGSIDALVAAVHSAGPRGARLLTAGNLHTRSPPSRHLLRSRTPVGCGPDSPGVNARSRA